MTCDSAVFFPPTVLLQHGADPSIRNTDGKTPLDVSADMDVNQVLTGKVYVQQDKKMSTSFCICHM